jgi:hypothetical protein
VKVGWAYKSLLRLYPLDHRARFNAQMLSDFQEVADECRSEGRGSFVRFVLAELSGLVAGAGVEWIAKLS